MFKKLILLIFFFLICSSAHATTWYLCTTPAGGWSNTSSWTSVSADQGTCAASLGAPAAGDTAILNSSSGNVALDSATADVAATVTMTGYTGTLTVTSADNLIVTGGTVTLGGTITGTGTLKVTGTETLTAGAVTWPGALTFAGTGAFTATLSNSGSTWTNTGLVTISTNTLTLNLTTTGDTLTANGGLTMSVSMATGSTAIIILSGGTWSSGGGTVANVTLAGNITVSGSVYISGGTLTYSSGTITVTGSTLFQNGAVTINTSGMTWNNFTFQNTNTVTLTSNLNIGGLLNVSTQNSPTMAGAYNITTFGFQQGYDSTFKIVAGQSLFITNSIKAIGNNPAGGNSNLIESATPSSTAYIVYSGSIANEEVAGMTFTDIALSAPPIPGIGEYLPNYFGGTLTRTSGILNVGPLNINKKAINYYNGV